MEIVDRHEFKDGIQDVWNIFPKIRINKRTCKDLVTAIKTYRLKKNERDSTDDKPAYFNEPVKDWTRHVADALRHLARAYRWQITDEHGRLIGYPHVIPANINAEGGYDPYEHNVLDFGRKT